MILKKLFGTYLFLKDFCYLDVIFHVGSMIHQFWSGSEVAKPYSFPII